MTRLSETTTIAGYSRRERAGSGWRDLAGSVRRDRVRSGGRGLARSGGHDPAGSARGDRAGVSARVGVPWFTVVSLAVVMAYGDGFWMTSLRGAVGAIERTQGPFANWLRESTLALPVFVFAVLGALTLALRWFGPVLRARTVVATGVLVAVAGTLVGIAQVGANSVTDYLLQSAQLELTHLTHHAHATKLLALQKQATLDVQMSSVLYGAVILLVTNLVLIGWVIAFRGGRLDTATGVPAGAPSQHAAPGPLPAEPVRDAGSRAGGLQVLLAAGLGAGALIHAAVVPGYLSRWALSGVFFIALAVAELAIAALLVAGPRTVPLSVRRQTALLAAAILSIGPLALWLYSRTVGIPFGPAAGRPEQPGLADLAACVLEAGTLLVAVVLLRGKDSPPRPPACAHLRWLALIAITAITTLGLAGTGLV